MKTNIGICHWKGIGHGHFHTAVKQCYRTTEEQGGLKVQIIAQSMIPMTSEGLEAASELAGSTRVAVTRLR